jgi:hypothetical protein
MGTHEDSCPRFSNDDIEASRRDQSLIKKGKLRAAGRSSPDERCQKKSLLEQLIGDAWVYGALNNTGPDPLHGQIKSDCLLNSRFI